jgi:hypothetical protein
MPERLFVGSRLNGDVKVYIVCGKIIEPLPLHLELRNHSPTGFEWGYMGSGPSQLALALLYEALKNERAARAIAFDFKREILTQLNYDAWVLSESEIRAWADTQLLEFSPDVREALLPPDTDEEADWKEGTRE